MSNEEMILRMKELHKVLKEASRAYYAENREIMSNFEYDALYDELCELEKESGIVLSGSPTQEIGYEAVKELEKIRHESPMLSLSKTKDREELREWTLSKECLLSWKLDGLTVVLTYERGVLLQAVTRGNGEVGELITQNARQFMNLPLSIAFKGRLVLRGEAVISYSDFEEMNARIPEADAKYKNPRNLCSGSVRQLDSSITAERRVRFYGFTLVSAEGMEFAYRREQFEFLKAQGFETVFYRVVNRDTILEAISSFAEDIKTYDIPSDGLVLTFDDIEYGRSLGRTAKFPRDAIAFKWADEEAETTLKYIEWSPSRTGLINPVAVFEPVELEGTTVSRASVHNVSVMRAMKLGIGDRICVYKANMIIPQISRNLTESGNMPVPEHCPACGGDTCIEKLNDVESLYCVNPDCPIKSIKSFTLFVSRDAMNVEGLSEATLEKFIGRGFIKDYADLFELDRYRDEIVGMEGFGLKSYENLWNSIQNSRKVPLAKLLFALGIPNIGLSTARLICKDFNDDLEAILNAGTERLSQIDQIGAVIAESFTEFFSKEKNLSELRRLLQYVELEQAPLDTNLNLTGVTVVITGSLNGFKDRSELKDIIVARGGKVAGSVSSKTTLLINNDNTSGSAKNKAAMELHIPILTEEEFVNKYLNN